MAPTPSSKLKTAHQSKTPQSKLRLNFSKEIASPTMTAVTVEHPVEVIGRIRNNLDQKDKSLPTQSTVQINKTATTTTNTTATTTSPPQLKRRWLCAIVLRSNPKIRTLVGFRRLYFATSAASQPIFFVFLFPVECFCLTLPSSGFDSCTTIKGSMVEN
ncbi:unnamed protein product [Fraxinus pennsylvanica]|uniref:Uncharacterized protein n=1 Tax=Fraxinus pennsylvanica TaxID=56036 RepID=A0AAD1Z3K8_9LAMI|nr:unnamed protein product [Fraxinus pennsylvanica]